MSLVHMTRNGFHDCFPNSFTSTNSFFTSTNFRPDKVSDFRLFRGRLTIRDGLCWRIAAFSRIHKDTLINRKPVKTNRSRQKVPLLTACKATSVKSCRLESQGKWQGIAEKTSRNYSNKTAESFHRELTTAQEDA